MSYQYNPHQHVKIWLTKKPDVFLNLENQRRLVEMRQKNPTDVIHFVYDSKLLNDTAKDTLLAFCDQYKITPIDVREKICIDLKSKEEQALFQFYEDEINHLQQGGNLGAASDLLRWLEPVYLLGTYTDFDVKVDTTSLPETITVETPLLFDIGSYFHDGVELIEFNNDVIAVVDPTAAAEKISAIRKAILKAFNDYGEVQYESEDEFTALLQHKFPSQWPFVVRQSILALTKDNQTFVTWMEGSDNNSVKLFADNKREEARDCLDELEEQGNDLDRAEITKLQRMLSLNDDELVTYIRENAKLRLLVAQVCSTSGPSVIKYSLFGDNPRSPRSFHQEVSPYSMDYYPPLQSVFLPKKAIKLGQSLAEYVLNQRDGLDENGDLSWLEEGEALQAEREKKLFPSAENQSLRFFGEVKKVDDKESSSKKPQVF